MSDSPSDMVDPVDLGFLTVNDSEDDIIYRNYINNYFIFFTCQNGQKK